MSLPPPPEDRSAKVVASVVMSTFGILALVAGVGVLLCGGLGWIMTGGLDTGAGAMLLVGLLLSAVGVVLLAGQLLVWRNR